MCGGGGHPTNPQYPILPRGGFRGWTPGTGPGRGKITGRAFTETNPMCIMTPQGGGSGEQRYGHPHSKAYRHYGRQAKKGGFWGMDRAGALLARVGAHPLGEVVAGRMRLREWARFELTPSAHETTCRYRRTCALVGWT